MTPEEFFKQKRVPKYRQRLVAALCSSITSPSYEKLSKESKKDFDLMFEEVVEPYSNYF